MKQLLVSRIPEPGAGLAISGDDFHYLHHVRRVKVGQLLNCRSADGHKCTCKVSHIAPDHLLLEAADPEIGSLAKPADSNQTGAGPALHLVQGIPKGKKLEQVIRQATELGVSSITPLKCRHSVADLDERWEKKRQHLDGVIREAFQQSGGSCLPVLIDPISPQEFCRNQLKKDGHRIFFLHEKELEQTSLHRYLDPRPASVTLIIGPEGGLAPEEIALFSRTGFSPVWLGPQTLRTETAAIVAMGIISLLLHESNAWSARIQESK